MKGADDNADIVAEIFALFERAGARSYGEGVSMHEHMLQSAALAVREGESPELTAACLLHDIGHFLHDEPEDAAEHGLDTRHESLGADYLAPHFPASVTEPVRLHVTAKRYLFTAEPGYGEALSPASRISLELQGGALTEAELEAFRASPYFQAAVRLRRYDEDGKVDGLRIAPLTEYRTLLGDLHRARRRAE